jgi:hypothetical protein
MIVVGKPKRRGCGCVKLGGCRPSGGLAGMGDVTPERLRGEWDRVFRETQAKFAKPLTYAQLYKEIAPHLERTNRNVGIAKTMKLRPGQLAELVAAAARLQKARNAAKVGYANTPNKIAGDLQAEAREAVLAPLRWLASLTGTALADSNARAALVKNAARNLVNAPGSIIAWAGEQATAGLKGFGLPGWLLPVGLVAAGLVLVGPYVAPLVLAARRRGAT